MKTKLFFLFTVVCSLTTPIAVNSQDTIIQKTGAIILCKIQREDSTTVSFILKRNGREIKTFMNKSDIQSVKYGILREKSPIIIDKTSFGIGLHIEQFRLNDINDLPQAPVNKLVLEISPNNNFRIEPEFGFRFGKNKSTDEKNSTVNFGIGIFGMSQHNKLNIYGGLRFEYGSLSQENTISASEKETDKTNRIMIGPALGSEYYLGENFSIGGELSLLYVSLKKTIEPKPTGYEDEKSNYFNTNTGLFLRFYF